MALARKTSVLREAVIVEPRRFGKFNNKIVPRRLCIIVEAMLKKLFFRLSTRNALPCHVFAVLELLERELFVQLQAEDKLEILELRNLSSMRVSNRVIPPSATLSRRKPRPGSGSGAQGHSAL